jgi:hypothetical protein
MQLVQDAAHFMPKNCGHRNTSGNVFLVLSIAGLYVLTLAGPFAGTYWCNKVRIHMETTDV